jgi:hypothetical protein
VRRAGILEAAEDDIVVSLEEGKIVSISLKGSKEREGENEQPEGPNDSSPNSRPLRGQKERGRE